MFENDYKNAMDAIAPSDEAIEKTRKVMNANSIKNHSAKNVLRMIAIACLLFAFIVTSVFAAFKINNEVVNYKNISSDNSEHESGNNIYYDPNAPVDFDGLRTAKSYDEIADILSNAKVYDVVEDYVVGEEGVPTEPSFNTGSDTDMPERDDGLEYTDTNNQVAGVQEGDIVKTDGKYIYFYSESHRKVFINEVDNGNIVQVSDITVEANYSFLEMFTIDNKLIFVCQDYSQSIVATVYYDITDREEPIYLNVCRQDGNYVSGRAQDGFVYIISTTPQTYDTDDFIPAVNDDMLEADRILIPDECQSTCFTIITSYDVINNKHMSSLSILGASDNLYVSQNNIYLTSVVFKNTDYPVYSRNTTKIYRVALNNGMPAATGAGYVYGNVNNQFWMDEKDGILRVAAIVQPAYVRENGDFVSFTEVGQSYNKVYCLGESLELIGESEKLGIDETIKSVRYIGDIAYVVTFRQTDPLYAVDLSNPTSPKTLSELKIDGFSTYMHPYGTDHLLGVGYNATALGAVNGLKLTMFDISDDSNIFDVSTLALSWENKYLDSEALSNHKAFLMDYNRGLFGIPLNVEKYVLIEDEIYKPFLTSEFVFFGFDGTQITEKACISLESNDEFYKWEWQQMRGLLIGDYAYVIGNSGIISVLLDEFEVVSRMLFK